MLEQFLNRKSQQFPILTNATASRMRWRLRNQVLLQTKRCHRRNAFDQARIETLGIKPKYITEVL